MNHSYSVLFWLQNHKISRKTGEIPISARLTVDGKRAEISTGKKVQADRWNQDGGKVKGNSEEARIINRHLGSMRIRLDKIYDQLEEQGQFISAQAVKNIYQGKTNKQHYLLELFQHHNDQIEAQVGIQYSAGTLERYKTAYRQASGFIKHHFGVDDYPLKDLTYSFASEYELYLKTVKRIGHNTSIKYIKQLKKIVLLAIKNEWLDKDPFARYEMAVKEVKKGFLTKEELTSIYRADFDIERLEQVRDIFLFCCYTGLSYSDVKKLTSNNISIGLDGEYWIFVDRTKTGSSSNVPLLPVAKEIAEKYEGNPKASNDGKLLPVISNQKMNAYLKEIAAVCGIHKHVTFHMARHTFATTVTLANGVAIESVGDMLGHKNLKTTQIYAKVVQEKVSSDMKRLKDILSENGDQAVNQ